MKTTDSPSVMTKKDAIDILTARCKRKSLSAAARVLEISQPALFKWPDQLTVRQADTVRGVATRLRLHIPVNLRREP